jgi:hypothetical protein
MIGAGMYGSAESLSDNPAAARHTRYQQHAIGQPAQASEHYKLRGVFVTCFAVARCRPACRGKRSLVIHVLYLVKVLQKHTAGRWWTRTLEVAAATAVVGLDDSNVV